jgi:hypothetical protein
MRETWQQLQPEQEGGGEVRTRKESVKIVPFTIPSLTLLHDDDDHDLSPLSHSFSLSHLLLFIYVRVTRVKVIP